MRLPAGLGQAAKLMLVPDLIYRFLRAIDDVDCDWRYHDPRLQLIQLVLAMKIEIEPVSACGIAEAGANAASSAAVRMKMLVTAALVPFLCAAALAQEPDVDRLQKGVVKIVSAMEGTRRTGAGFVVGLKADAAVILTAAHVVEGASSVDVEFFTDRGRFHIAKVVGVEGGDANGVAALSVRGKLPDALSVLRLRPDAPVRAGAAFVTIGFPSAGGAWAVSRGEIAGRRARLLSISGAIDEGNSGGPVVLGGEVVGMVVATRPPFSFAVPAVIADYVLGSWGVRYPAIKLRREPARVTAEYLEKFIRDNGLSHPGKAHPQYQPMLIAPVIGTFVHEYEPRNLEGADVIIDRSTGLMWQKGCSGGGDQPPKAAEYVAELNRKRFAGLSDWRVPTMEELATLTEPVANDKTGFVSEVFERCAGMGSADTRANQEPWGLNVFHGFFTAGKKLATRAVRNLED